MRKALPFNLLIDLAKKESDEAARKLGELNRKSRDIDEKLVLLFRYRQEYQSRFDASTREGMSKSVWDNYQNFMLKLDEAIELQQQLQTDFAKIVDAGRIEYQHRLKKLKSFETLAQRHREREEVIAERREQKETDDFSSKVYLRRLMEEE